MFEQLIAITRNTFFESIRQPIMLVVIVISTLLIILSNPLSAFTMHDDQKMLIDIGMATVFFSGALLAAFIATNVLGQEIENRTVLTVVSKPVGRPLFVIGKFFGVAGAMALATLFLSLVFMLAELHSVIQTVRDPLHLPVLTFGISAGLIGTAAAIWCNFFYNKVFASSILCFTTPLLALAYFFSLLFDHDFVPKSIGDSFNSQVWLGLISVLVAIMVLSAIAITASTRLGQVMTLMITIGIFMSGLLSDWYIGRQMGDMRTVWMERADELGHVTSVEIERQVVMVGGEVQSLPLVIKESAVPLMDMAEGAEVFTYGLWKVCYTVVPNFQVLWLSDAITQEHVIPAGYMMKTSVYGLIYIVFALSVGVILFQRREVG
ncbi:MAG: hypothetical protein O7G85_08970 [Planctomycetota bacterium]|nr:hypothetical protein [Planctomycetota bacterium]